MQFHRLEPHPWPLNPNNTPEVEPVRPEGDGIPTQVGQEIGQQNKEGKQAGIPLESLLGPLAGAPSAGGTRGRAALTALRSWDVPAHTHHCHHTGARSTVGGCVPSERSLTGTCAGGPQTLPHQPKQGARTSENTPAPSPVSGLKPVLGEASGELLAFQVFVGQRRHRPPHFQKGEPRGSPLLSHNITAQSSRGRARARMHSLESLLFWV